MKNDRAIENAIAAGERNKEAIGLIRNWCSHARVEKFGGTGLIERETGLPIGHNSMACQYASGGGMATWDLADAAIDFYDRNCVQCTKRVLVGIPNLSKLVAERDAHTKRVEEAQCVLQAKLAAELAARTVDRQEIRSRQPAESVSILDIIDDLDNSRDESARQKLLGAATLASETFTPDIIEYCFGLLEIREEWFDDIGLQLLRLLKADTPRLVRCAMLSLATHNSVAIAFEIIQVNARMIDEAQIQAAFPVLVWRAEPEQIAFINHVYIQDPLPLVAVYQERQKAVEAAISKALDDRDPDLVCVGARAIIVLSQFSNLRAGVFARSLIAKLARAHLLMDESGRGQRGDEEIATWLQDALVFALKDDPKNTDELVGQFLAGASVEGEEKIYRAYAAVLHKRGAWRDEKSILHPASRLALRRFFGAISSSNEYDILQVVQDAFSHMPDCAISLARDEMATLLGAAICLDDRINVLNEGQPEQLNALAALDRSNMLQLMYGTQQTLVKWAAESAAGDGKAIAEYLDVLRKIPEGKDSMRAILTSNLHQLMNMPAGLSAALPDLYSAMMHVSPRVRSAATDAIGELSRMRLEDLPELFFEAFLMHLSDTYMIVHQSAVEALDRLKLSAEFEARAGMAVVNLINCYAIDQGRERFLVKCIRLFLRRFAKPQQKKGALGKIFVALLERVESDLIARDLWWLSRDLGDVEGFSGLVIKALSDGQVMRYHQEEVVRALNTLRVESILEHSSDLISISLAPQANRDLAPAIVETLTRVGSWDDALQICQALYDNIPDTTEKLIGKLYAKLHLIAAQYEASIAAGKMEELSTLSRDWKETESQIKKLRSENEKRSHSFPGLSRSHWRR
ncbi:hypothetical protein [Collimonas pratensis]|uniref:HEAT repeat family protein n=1 Tax=Collimonas pratensis TaxID=279113 RepID=A0ABM5Z2L9_9BURK|nr:hypothetical protein [Collimonas pratensis]AMP13290.1 HEAT repeat family protein [Collimonas pratensis]